MIELDFTRDWRSYVEQRLSVFGINNWTSLSTEELTLRYFDQQRRRITCRTRTVKETSALVIPEEHLKDYAALKEKITKGEDLTLFLSRRLKKYPPHDGALYEWGLHHLHFRKKGVAETRYLLFVKVTENEVYVIKTEIHGNSWVNTELISILERNWPHLLVGSRLSGAQGEMLTTEQRANLRKVNVNAVVSLESGGAYHAGGIASSGFSMYDVVRQLRAMSEIRRMEEHVHASEIKIREALLLDADEHIELEMMLDEDIWFYDRKRKARLNLSIGGIRIPK